MKESKPIKLNRKELTDFSAVIQVCPKCGKIDVYKNDGHECDRVLEEIRQENQEYYD